MEDNNNTARCRVCQNGPEDLLRCTRCGEAHYCSRDHQKQDWNRHKTECKLSPGPTILSTDVENEFEGHVKIRSLQLQDCDPETLAQVHAEMKAWKAYIATHPFPGPDRVRHFIKTGTQNYDLKGQIRLFDYGLAKRLYDAPGKGSTAEIIKEIRRIGYLLKKSIYLMRFHYYLIQHVYVGEGLYPKDRETSLLMAAYTSFMEASWDGIGDCRA